MPRLIETQLVIDTGRKVIRRKIALDADQIVSVAPAYTKLGDDDSLPGLFVGLTSGDHHWVDDSYDRLTSLWANARRIAGERFAREPD